MRIEGSVTSISWIPSEAIKGVTKLPFSMGVAHYDDPRWASVAHRRSLRHERRRERIRLRGLTSRGRRWAGVLAVTIQPDAAIKLGRQLFKAPTGAAKEALNAGSIDGWLRWRVPHFDRWSPVELVESS